MTSQIKVVRVADRQWEVMEPNGGKLGTFYDEASLDLFVEALVKLIPLSIGETELPIVRMTAPAAVAAA
jgi:hypothetical protein